MNDIIAVMLDVSGLGGRGADVARIEARRIAAERERRAAANVQSLADQLAAAVAHETDRIPARPRGRLLGAWTRAFRVVDG